MAELAGLRGIALARRGGQAVMDVVSGQADESAARPNSHDTRFQLASVSKQFTAAAILLLADRGRLGVADPVSSWLDGCPAAWQDITIRHLLTHTSGIGHWADMPAIDPRVAMDAGEQIGIVQRALLVSAPGARWYYSSLGYFLLAHIAQRAAGRAYATLLTEEIFQPLGMTSTFAGNGRDRPDRAVGYAGGQPSGSYDLDQTNLGAGDVWSTSGDLVVWDAAVAGRRLLSHANWTAALASQAPVSDDDGLVVTDGYGYGWMTGSVAGNRMLFHTGGNAGFRTINALLPGLDAQVILLSNEETTDLDSLGGQVLRAALA